MSEEKTAHDWMIAPYGYDPADYCRKCRASSYDTQTKFCEDYHEELVVNKEKASRTHVATEAAWDRARSVLTKEEWMLMELYHKCGRVYREKDYIGG